MAQGKEVEEKDKTSDEVEVGEMSASTYMGGGDKIAQWRERRVRITMY